MLELWQIDTLLPVLIPFLFFFSFGFFFLGESGLEVSTDES
jgi:hypothetical protein